MVDLELIFHITDCGENQVNIRRELKNNGEKPETTDAIVYQSTAIYYALLNELVKLIQIYNKSDLRDRFIQEAIKKLEECYLTDKEK